MHSTLVSECAGLATALLWAIAAMCWAELGRRMPPTGAAAMRMVLAIAAMILLHLALFGTAWPTRLPPAAFWMLAFSGLVGSGIGDVLYFHSIRQIGPRLTLTIISLTPAAAALLAMLPPMHEHLALQEIAGMGIAICGVLWVVLEKDGRNAWPASPANFKYGTFLAVISVLCQALGYVSSRAGMNAFTAAPVPAFSATLVRVAAGCLRNFAF